MVRLQEGDRLAGREGGGVGGWVQPRASRGCTFPGTLRAGSRSPWRRRGGGCAPPPTPGSWRGPARGSAPRGAARRARRASPRWASRRRVHAGTAGPGTRAAAMCSSCRPWPEARRARAPLLPPGPAQRTGRAVRRAACSWQVRRGVSSPLPLMPPPCHGPALVASTPHLLARSDPGGISSPIMASVLPPE